jgi:hypothetical protein
MGRHHEKRGKEELRERGDCISGLGIFWFCCWVLQFLVNHCRGHQVAGGFGHGGQDSFRYPGARELDRLLLAGWVVSRFG